MRTWYEDEVVKGMPHWQSPPWVDDRSSFDAAALAQSYFEAGIRTICPHAKHVDGFCFFPSRYRDDPLERDFLGEIIREASLRGIRTVPYYMVVVDRLSATLHPDWVCQNSDGSVKEGFGSIFCCINHPGYRGFVTGQVRELIERYDIHGIWSDELNWSDEGCFCSYCRERYRKERGADLFMDRGTPKTRSFFNDCWRELTAELHSIVKSQDEHNLFIYNGGGLHSYCDDFGQFAAVNSCEAHNALFASERCRYLRGLRKPFEICFVTEKEWGGLLSSTKDEVRLVAAEIAAHDGMIMLSTNVTAQGRLLRRGMEFVGEAVGYIGRMKEYIGDTTPMYDVGVVWSGPEEPKIGYALMQQDLLHCYMTISDASDWMSLPLILNQTWTGPLHGAKRGKDDVDDIFEDGSIPGLLRGASLEKVRRYVEEGGVFVQEMPHIGVMQASAMPEALEHLFGVRIEGIDESDGHYIQTGPGISQGLDADLPILIPGPSLRIRATTADTWADLVYPIRPLSAEFKTQKFITNSPDDRIPHTAAITVNRYGKGLAVLVSAPVTRACMAMKFGKGHPFHYWPRLLLGNLLRALVEKPCIQRSTPLGVEVVLNQQKEMGRYVLHLFNHYGIRGVPYGRESYYEPNPETVRLKDVEIVVNENRLGAIKGWSTLHEAHIEGTRVEGAITLRIPSLLQHEIILLETE